MKKIAKILLLLCVLYSPLAMAQSTIATDVKTKTSEKKQLIIYGSDACHHCTDTKKFLNDIK